MQPAVDKIDSRIGGAATGFTVYFSHTLPDGPRSFRPVYTHTV